MNPIPNNLEEAAEEYEKYLRETHFAPLGLTCHGIEISDLDIIEFMRCIRNTMAIERQFADPIPRTDEDLGFMWDFEYDLYEYNTEYPKLIIMKGFLGWMAWEGWLKTELHNDDYLFSDAGM